MRISDWSSDVCSSDLVPVGIRDLSDAQSLELAIVENVQRQDLTPLEEAEGYRRLIDEFEHTQEDLARTLGKSRPHITNTLRLLSLTQGVKLLLDEGELTAGHARTLIGCKDAESLAQQDRKSTRLNSSH